MIQVRRSGFASLPRTPRTEQSLLVWDSFRAHLTDEVKEDLNRRKECSSYPWRPDPHKIFELAGKGAHLKKRP